MNAPQTSLVQRVIDGTKDVGLCLIPIYGDLRIIEQVRRDAPHSKGLRVYQSTLAISMKYLTPGFFYSLIKHMS